LSSALRPIARSYKCFLVSHRLIRHSRGRSHAYSFKSPPWKHSFETEKGSINFYRVFRADEDSLPLLHLEQISGNNYQLSTSMSDLNYKLAGVNYEPLDAFKRLCQSAAAGTRSSLKFHGLTEPAKVRGESAYLLEGPDSYLAHVEEGLGTKNLVADVMRQLTGQCFYRAIGIDTVATMVNDLITCGALPVMVAMHAGVGDADWFADSVRAKNLADGFAEGCRQSRAVWAGGETPALKGIISPDAIVLAGSAVGGIAPKENRIAGDVQNGDAIILLASSGVQTNGLTLCRALAERLPNGYLAPIDDGRPYGQALLDPSIIYVSFIAACQQAQLRLHYAAHLTGHGWRKLMRLDESFIYRMTDIGPVPPIFGFIQQASKMSDEEMYATFNMGAGFAVYVAPADAHRCLLIARQAGYDAWVAGHVEKSGSTRLVEIVPLGIRYESESLQIR
jgi:phosphoribosylformylglycinamidine cyclo-ligase